MNLNAAISGLLVIIIAALTLAQGGFFPISAVIAGTASVIVAAIGFASCKKNAIESIKNRWKSFLLPAAIVLVSLVNFISAAANGVLSESLVPSLAWLGLAIFSAASLTIASEVKRASIEYLCWFMAATTLIGIAVSSGLIPSDGVFAANRLCVLFEYSNATGIWFGIAALLMAASDDSRLNGITSLPLFSLLTTKSVGAISVCLVFTVIVWIILFRKGDNAKASMFSLSWVVALIGFAVYLFSPLIGSLLALAFGIAGFIALPTSKDATSPIRQFLASTRTSIVLGCSGLIVMVALVAGSAFIDAGRILQSFGTFEERLDQIGDGFKLLSSNVICGIGPGQWATSYQSIQTTDYIAAVNHCSYLQMALDGGVLAPLIYIAAMVLSIRASFKRGEWPFALPVCMLLAHSVFDFDLSFYALQFLAVYLISGSIIGPSISESPKVKQKRTG